MTLTFGLAVPFLIVHSALGYGPLGFGPKYLYSVMKPADYWPVIEYQPPESKKTQENYTSPVFLTNRSTTNRVVEFYAVCSVRVWVYDILYMFGSVFIGNHSHFLHSAMVPSLSTLQTKLH